MGHARATTKVAFQPLTVLPAGYVVSASSIAPKDDSGGIPAERYSDAGNSKLLIGKEIQFRSLTPELMGRRRVQLRLRYLLVAITHLRHPGQRRRLRADGAFRPTLH